MTSSQNHNQNLPSTKTTGKPTTPHGADSLVLSLDIGTSSTRVLLWDLQAREIPEVRAQVQYRMTTTADGGVEVEAKDLLHHVGECLDSALSQAGAERASRIRAVGISTFWHSLLGISKSGEPITPVYLYSDNRSGATARRLRGELDEHAIHARTGCVIHPSYYPSKLVWLRETQRGTFDKVYGWISPSEYLFAQWFGPEAAGVSVSMASGTGLMNQEKCAWDTETFKAFGLDPSKLSDIVDLSRGSCGLKAEFAKRWPALKDAPFYPAVGDGACGNVGSGCIGPERLAINLGTSGAIRSVWDETAQPHAASLVTAPPAGLWRYRVDRRRPVMGAAFSDGGNVFAWMKRTLVLPGDEELENAISAMEPGEHKLLFLPFLAGERSIGWNPDARASLVGITQDTSAVEIVRASMEAVALRFALAARLLRGVFPEAHEIIASGGALSHSPAWAQMFADSLGQPLTLAAEPEASSRGAALLAMEAAGLISSSSKAKARLGRTFTPNTKYHARYVEMLAEQQQRYAQLV